MGRGVGMPWVGGSKYHLSNNKEFRFLLIGIFPTLPQSEYTSREVYSVKIFKNFKSKIKISIKFQNFHQSVNNKLAFGHLFDTITQDI